MKEPDPRSVDAVESATLASKQARSALGVLFLLMLSSCSQAHPASGAVLIRNGAKGEAACSLDGAERCPLGSAFYDDAILTLDSVTPELTWRMAMDDAPAEGGGTIPGYDIVFGATGTTILFHPYLARARNFGQLDDDAEREAVESEASYSMGHFGLAWMDRRGTMRIPSADVAEMLSIAWWHRRTILDRETSERLGIDRRAFDALPNADRDTLAQSALDFLERAAAFLEGGNDLCDARGAFVFAAATDAATAFSAGMWHPPPDDGQHHARGMEPLFSQIIHQAILRSPLGDTGDVDELYRDIFSADCPVQERYLDERGDEDEERPEPLDFGPNDRFA